MPRAAFGRLGGAALHPARAPARNGLSLQTLGAPARGCCMTPAATLLGQNRARRVNLANC
eukprot:5341568-Lingulodinium_polyedra.AAC.1